MTTMKAPQPLSIVNETVNGQPLVRVAGEIDLNSSPAFRTGLLNLLERKSPMILIDLGGVTYVDSSGVGTIVELKRRADRAGTKVVLFGLQARVRSIFEITRLDKFLSIVATLEEAKSA